MESCHLIISSNNINYYKRLSLKFNLSWNLLVNGDDDSGYVENRMIKKTWMTTMMTMMIEIDGRAE